MDISLAKWKVFKEAHIFSNAKWVVCDERGLESLFNTGQEALDYVNNEFRRLGKG